MNHAVMHYGLTTEQAMLLGVALPQGYELSAGECVTDLIVTNVICTIIDTSQINRDIMNVLLAYYLDVGEQLDETVVWLGNIAIPDLPSFVRCESFLELLTELESIVAQAQCRYDGMQMYGCGYAYLPKHAVAESMEADVYAALRSKGGDSDLVRRQWQRVLEAGAAEELAAMYELTRWLKCRGYVFRVTCKTGFPLILELLDITAEMLPQKNPSETDYVFHLPECLKPRIRQWQESHWLSALENIRFDFWQ